jgi:hypothetical protein
MYLYISVVTVAMHRDLIDVPLSLPVNSLQKAPRRVAAASECNTSRNLFRFAFNLMAPSPLHVAVKSSH